jgi:hypothetical protein
MPQAQSPQRQPHHAQPFRHSYQGASPLSRLSKPQRALHRGRQQRLLRRHGRLSDRANPEEVCQPQAAGHPRVPARDRVVSDPAPDLGSGTSGRGRMFRRGRRLRRPRAGRQEVGQQVGRHRHQFDHRQGRQQRPRRFCRIGRRAAKVSPTNGSLKIIIFLIV